MGYCPLWSTSYILGLWPLLPELVPGSWGKSVYINTLCSELGYRECIAILYLITDSSSWIIPNLNRCASVRGSEECGWDKRQIYGSYLWFPEDQLGLDRILLTYILTYLQTKYRITLLWQTSNSKLSSFWSGVARWKNWRNAVSILAPSWKNCWWVKEYTKLLLE